MSYVSDNIILIFSLYNVTIVINKKIHLFISLHISNQTK